MKSPVLKRRLNPFLLATTVLVLALLAGLSVMYQGQLSDILSDKKSLEEQLEQKNQELSRLRSEKANLTQELQQKDDRISSLATESSNLESEISSLEDDISTLEAEISDKEDQIAELEDENENLSTTLDFVNISLGEICEDDYSNITEDSQEECDEWGHEP